VALDASPEALLVAKENVGRNNVTDRIELVHGDGFATLPGGAKFDLIISNPPYIPSAEIATLQIEVRDFDPRAALDGGPDGLAFYRLFAAQAAAYLRPGGKIMLEFGDGQAAAIQELFASQDWAVEAVRADYTQRERFLIVRREG